MTKGKALSITVILFLLSMCLQFLVLNTATDIDFKQSLVILNLFFVAISRRAYLDMLGGYVSRGLMSICFYMIISAAMIIYFQHGK